MSNLGDQNRSLAGDGGFSRRALLRYAGSWFGGQSRPSPLLSACGSSSSSSTAKTAGKSATITKLSMQLSWVEDSSFSPLYIADTRGYFTAAERGSEAHARAARTSERSRESWRAVAADIGIASDITTVIAAIGDGNPLVCVGAFYQSNLNVMMSDPKNPLTSVKQLTRQEARWPAGHADQV